MTDAHEHTYLRWATFHHAPIGEPPAHTAFTVMVCECGVWDTFPEENYALATEAFQTVLRGAMLVCGYHPVALVEEASELVAAGGTHDCWEWRTGQFRCVICGQPLAS